MKISIGSDHAGFELKSAVITWLSENEVDTVIDFGTDSLESVDYPDIAHAVVGSLIDGEVDLSILICGSANGMSMCANKWRGIRAALCWLPEIAKLAKLHNDANVLCLPARFITELDAIEIVKSFIETEFEGGRHQNRINKINTNF